MASVPPASVPPEGPAAEQLREQVLRTTLALAEEQGWENVRLYQVAERLDLPLAEIARHFRDLDAVANAWFARARDAMLADVHGRVAGLAPPERLHVVIMAWFAALEPHRDVAGEILAAKRWPAHVHHWVPMIFELSRLVHWFLDAARIASTGRRRQMAESGLTLIFLDTLRVWLRDHTPDRLRTRNHLWRRLEAADRLLARRRSAPRV